MQQGKKTISGIVIRWGSLLLVAIFVITCNLSNHVDALKCDIVHGSDHLPSYSATKEEAIQRKTFVCDIKLPSKAYKVSTTHIITINRGWIEQSWRSGFWYQTTTKDTGKDISYRIVLECDTTKGKFDNWTVMNNQETDWGQVVLQYNDGGFTGHIDKLPLSDTLRYTVLKNDTLDFKPENIEGTLILILEKHMLPGNIKLKSPKS